MNFKRLVSFALFIGLTACAMPEPMPMEEPMVVAEDTSAIDPLDGGIGGTGVMAFH